MKILCVFGQHNYGDPDRGLGYEYTNFIPALKRLGSEVLFFETLNKSCYADFIDMNRKLLQVVEREKPDIVFCVLMTYEIWLETLELIREGSNAALVHWATDDSWKYEQSSRFIAPAFDLHATTYLSAIDKAVEDKLENFVLTQWAADSGRMQPPLEAKQCRYQVSFVGSAYGNRKKWLENLEQQGVKVNAFGHGWPHGPVETEEVASIIRASVISLNFADSGIQVKAGKPLHDRQIKARVFEVPGAGGLLATEDADRLDCFYTPDEEIIVFADKNDLVSKIEYLLANPKKRDAIARAGFARTEAAHTYEMRFSPIIEQTLERRKLRPCAACGIDFEHFEKIAESHQPHLLLKVLRQLLLFPCRLIWGSRRGPRAARRFLFEFSWRLMGRKTYSASGWPGRIFYKYS